MNYYHDYDYEAEPNYPEVEEIIENASGEFSKFLHDTFVSEYKSIEVANQNNANKEKKLNERSNSLDARERALQEREADLSKAEEEQYGKLKQKWFTELGLAFDIGSTVYYCKNITGRITCPTCNGAKRVKANIESADCTLSHIEISCPTCAGYGTVSAKKTFEVVEAVVEQIDVHISKRWSGNIVVECSNFSGELTTFVWVKDKKGGESHQLNGCGLFKTPEEADARIKELLSKERK